MRCLPSRISVDALPLKFCSRICGATPRNIAGLWCGDTGRPLSKPGKTSQRRGHSFCQVSVHDGSWVHQVVPEVRFLCCPSDGIRITQATLPGLDSQGSAWYSVQNVNRDVALISCCPWCRCGCVRLSSRCDCEWWSNQVLRGHRSVAFTRSCPSPCNWYPGYRGAHYLLSRSAQSMPRSLLIALHCVFNSDGISLVKYRSSCILREGRGTRNEVPVSRSLSSWYLLTNTR